METLLFHAERQWVLVFTVREVIARHNIASTESLLMHVCRCLRVDVLGVLKLLILNCILFHVIITLRFGAFMVHGIWC